MTDYPGTNIVRTAYGNGEQKRFKKSLDNETCVMVKLRQLEKTKSFEFLTNEKKFIKVLDNVSTVMVH